jgi:hypothetical protein
MHRDHARFVEKFTHTWARLRKIKNPAAAIHPDQQTCGFVAYLYNKDQPVASVFLVNSDPDRGF